MKKLLVCIFCISALLQGCSMDDGFWKEEGPAYTNFPAASEELGKAVAKELRQLIYNLNEMGVDYSHGDNSREFMAQVYEDLYKAYPGITKSQGVFNPIGLDPEVLSAGRRNLTEIQIQFVERIITEFQSSTSYENLSQRLLNINKDIYALVPEIEQERLFNVTAILYYAFNEICDLEIQGQMINTPYSGIRPVLVKSGNESDGGSWLGSCRQIIAYTWTLAVGELYNLKEIVTALAPTVTGAVLVTLCIFIPGDTSEAERVRKRCTDKYVDCVQDSGMPNWKCDECRINCMGQFGEWDCPRPH